MPTYKPTIALRRVPNVIKYRFIHLRGALRERYELEARKSLSNDQDPYIQPFMVLFASGLGRGSL